MMNPYLSVSCGKLNLEYLGLKWNFLSTEREKFRATCKRLGIREAMCSSSVDFPEEYGWKSDVDLNAFVHYGLSWLWPVHETICVVCGAKNVTCGH